jgi:hypothetical protein
MSGRRGRAVAEAAPPVETGPYTHQVRTPVGVFGIYRDQAAAERWAELTRGTVEPYDPYPESQYWSTGEPRYDH